MTILAALCAGAACAAAALVLVGRSDPVEGAPRLRDRVRSGRISRAQWLHQAGSTWTPGQLRVACLAVGVGVFAGLALVTRALLVAVPPALGAATLPRAYWARRRVVRMREWQAAWPDALRELIAAAPVNPGETRSAWN